MSKLDYEKIANDFKPIKLKTLLIGEAPPSNGKSFFYKVPKKYAPSNTIVRDSSLSATIFNHYFGRRPSDSNEYELYLKALKATGVFLIDISTEPLEIRTRNGLNKKNIAKLISNKNLEKLRERIKKLNPEKVIFLLPRTNYRDILINKFIRASYITWICFRMYIHEAKNIKNYKLNDMLLIQKGKCEKCGCEFNTFDTVQSTNVECNNCKHKSILCKKCKEERCEKCGCEFLNTWEKLPGILY